MGRFACKCALDSVQAATCCAIALSSRSIRSLDSRRICHNEMTTAATVAKKASLSILDQKTVHPSAMELQIISEMKSMSDNLSSFQSRPTILNIMIRASYRA